MKKALKHVFAVMVLALVLGAALPAAAHFQMLYTPDCALLRGGLIELKLVFTHPFEAGHTMDMATPKRFFVVHKGQREDLMELIKPITWTSQTNSGKAWELSGYRLKGMGDFIFCLVPAPYYEGSEDVFIQQCTKMIVNVAGSPTDWDVELGLPAEIVPLAKPYAQWTGNVFQGVVKGAGKPVPFAEVEVEYLNHAPDMKNNRFDAAAAIEAPQDAFVTMTIHADANGTFTFAMPKAGWWGFCALGVGPDTKYDGKELSQDAVIWVKAVDPSGR
jgi:cobalt/nickel transport protein